MFKYFRDKMSGKIYIKIDDMMCAEVVDISSLNLEEVNKREEYIRRIENALKSDNRSIYCDIFTNAEAAKEILELLKEQPKQKKGKWIVTSEFEDCRYVKCNQCKVTQVFYYNKPLTNFCPNCGSDNRGK